MLSVQLIVGLVSSIVANCVCQDKLTNIDYLGLGYDAINGNPHCDLRDPGFREAVFKLSYSTNTVSQDGKWLIPDNVQALQTYSCSYETDTSVIQGTSSYVDSLAVDASISGKAWFVKFSASTDYQTVKQGSSLYRNTYVSSVAKCQLYQASIKRLTDNRVTDDFFRAVSSLPLVRDDTSYLNFISVYGTHFASTLDMGSKAILRSEFKQAAWTSMQQVKFNFQAGARASFFDFAGDFNVSTSTESQLSASFEGNRSSMTASFTGSRPSSDGRWESWKETTLKSPYPISYVLRPLTDVLTNQYFPNKSANELATKQYLLNSTYDVYCSNVPGCGVPSADRAAVKLDVQDTAIINTQQVKCPLGLSLLSCGIDNLPFSTTAETKRSAIPADSESCVCYAIYGLRCLPWCTNSVQNFSIRTSSFIKGDMQVYCPADTKVVGCAVDTRSGSGEESYKAFYPMRDGSGSGCSCYASLGAQCHATCAGNIQNHEILSQYGRGNVTVQCSPNNFVFGCGLQPLKSGPAESFRTHFASSINSCQCYDRYGATCYAICGQFA